MTTEELKPILDLHRKWWNGESGGKCADLQCANLQGAYLQGAYLQRADLQRADLQRADLRGADLRGANLRGANLQRANLQRANLQRANLQRADLQRADLRGADLQGAIGAFYKPDLDILKLCTGKIIAWKFVKKDGKTIYQGAKYEVGKSYKELKKDCDYNENNECGKGLNVATLLWCYRNRENESDLFLKCEFEAKDIVAIPTATDGKFRVKKLKIIKSFSIKQVEKILEVK